ncbi:hypothetical protein RR46_13084 [Papilio xuthus]|uniref:C3H1-type domain-containing protein n=1 Tax=Papilio xuthus TaxID=66420 RepID=A0A194PMF6_PAPXU|nr:hypothetical protein RR46_13084 [Papilio xuthus]
MYVLRGMRVCCDIRMSLSGVRRVAGCGLQVVGCRVVVCRDAAAGTCRRAACRYYHIPVQLPPALRPP